MMVNRRIVSLVGVLALVGCANPELEAKVNGLEAKVSALEGKVASAGPQAAGPADPAKEAAARAEAEKVREMIANLDTEGAKAKVAEIEKTYAGTRTARSLGRTKAELAVVGKDAGALDVEKWFQGESTMNDGKATLLVFWEVWCPHCKREVPKLQATYTKYHDQGLNLVGVTKVTRSATDEKVQAFIDENDLTYPVAKEKGDNLSTYFGVRGVPAAAIVKEGKVVWRGHPGRLTDAMIEKLL